MKQTVQLPGFSMVLYGDNYLEREIIEKLAWEPSTTQFFRRTVKNGWTVVDVGANIGYFSLLSASLVGPAGEVHAFEPYSGYIGRMKESLRVNNFNNIRLNEFALSDRRETHRLFKGLASARMHRWSHPNPVFNEVHDEEDVECVRLDDYAADNLSRLDLIKIDVGGYEINVLEGAEETIKRYQPIIVIEVFEEALRDAGKGVADLLDLFRRWGYLPYSEQDELFDYEELLARAEGEPKVSVNVVFRPRVNVQTTTGLKTINVSSKRRMGLVIDRRFHEENRWCSATTFHLVEALKENFECVYIQNQRDYEKKLGDIELLISMEPGWASPVLELTRTRALREKLAKVPSYIFFSDPHANKWRQDYFLRNGLDYVLSFYYAPFRRHFTKIPPGRVIHFPWAIPDEWVDEEPIRFRGQSKICCFGGQKSEAYSVRNWCRGFEFVESADNSGVENKVMSEAEYIDWLKGKDAAIAAGSDSPRYKLTMPKYFEIAAAGSLLFAQQTEDLAVLGFEHNENCIIFERSNFERLAKKYLSNPENYLPIRRAGRELIRRRHLLSNRMKLLQTHVSTAIKQKSRQDSKQLPVIAAQSDIKSSDRKQVTTVPPEKRGESHLTDTEYWDGDRKEEFKPWEVKEDEFSEIFEKYLPVNDKFTCVEIGAYPGIHLCYLAKKFKYYPVAIDFSEHCDHIEKLLRFNGIEKYKVLNQDFFEPVDMKFDVVMSFGFIEHFENYEEVIDRHVELLKPGGYLLMSCPYLDNFQGKLRELVYTEEKLQQVISSHNLKVMNLDEIKRVLGKYDMEICFSDFIMGNKIWFDPNADYIKPEMKWLVKYLLTLNTAGAERIASSKLYSPMIMVVGRKKSNVRKENSGPVSIYDVVEKRQWLSREDIGQSQFRDLKALLAHCYSNVPFYRERFEKLGLRPDDIRSLDDFRKVPLLTKADIQQERERMRAMNCPSEQLMRDATGGSTGEPLVFYSDINAKAWIDAACIRFRRWLGYGPDSKLALIWGADRDVPESYPDNQRWLNTFNCSPEQIEEFVEELVRWKPDAIRAYASSLYMVASYIKERGLKAPRPGAIEAAAEKLWPYQRKVVEEVFGCKVFEMYGSREVPCLACECEEHNGMHIFSDLRLVEIIKDGRVARPGEEGSIVVTDLVNYGMPFIRYEIGDVGVVSESKCPCGRGFPLLEDIKGRITSTIRTPDGRSIHGEYFTHLFYNVEGVKAFQVHQKGVDDVEVLIQPDSGFDFSVIKPVVERMRSHLGEGVNVKWRCVDDIPVAPSGKRHFTVSDVPVDFADTLKDGVRSKEEIVVTSQKDKKKILFIVDEPGWAHDFKTESLISHLGDIYDIRKSYRDTVTAEDIIRADLIVVYYWKVFNYPNMEQLLDLFAQNRHKLLLGICSHQEMEAGDRGEILQFQKKIASAIFVNSMLLYEEFSPCFDVPVFYTPNGVDTNFFKPGRVKKSDKLQVGWAGSITNHIGTRGYHDYIVPAVNSVEGVELVTAAREQKWRNKKEMLEFYRSIDVYICASTAEGTPNPCLEAAACGVPLVTTRVGNMPQLVEDGVNGFFIERNVENIADRLKQLRDEPQLLEKLSQNILESIKGWDWSKQAENYREMFEVMLGADSKMPQTKGSLELSVVLTAYNRPELLEKVLDGFAGQTVDKEEFEVIVIDDGSEPSLKNTVEKFGDSLNVVYLRQDNSGLAAARNTGIASAKGGIVLFSDDDDVPGPELVAEHIRSHRENPDETVAVLGHLEWDESLKRTLLMDYVSGRGGQYFSYTRLRDGQFYETWKWWGGLISAKLSLLKSLDGPFDSNLRFGYEDTELVCRLLKRNVRILYNANARSYILRPVDFKTFCERSYRQGRSLRYVARKHPGIIIPRYKLHDAAADYHKRYEPYLDKWTEKVERFEVMPDEYKEQDSEQGRRLCEAVCKIYAECFRGYLLKGYVECLEEEEGKASDEIRNDQRKLPVRKAKRIVFINTNTPGFDVGSSNLRIYHILKILAGEGHELDFVYFNEYENDARYIDAFRGEVNFIRLKRTVGELADYFNGTEDRPVDAVWMTNIWGADYASFCVRLTEWLRSNMPRAGVFIDTMDFHYKKLRRGYEVSGRAEDLAEAQRFLGIERQLYALADMVVTVSEQEKRDILAGISEELCVETIPNIHSLSGGEGLPPFESRRNICFLGPFKTGHNKDAVLWFLKEVWPVIHSERPDVEFHVLGYGNEKFRAPLERIANVKVIGYVEDAVSALGRYKLFVCPLRFGAGLKGKIGEAITAGTPVVGTTVGVEGFDFADGRECFIADEPKEFAEKCLRLLEDEKLWRSFSTNSRKMVAEKFSPEAVRPKLLSLLDKKPERKEVRRERLPVGVEDKSKPAVSIIVASYNCREYLGECLDSIERQTFSRWEALIIDDNSTDGTREVIERYAAKDERIRPFYFEDNKGAYVRLNFGIDKARADYIVVHDADDIMDERKVELLYNEIISDEQLALVGSFYRTFLERFTCLEDTDRIDLPLEHGEIVAMFEAWKHAMGHSSAIIRKDLLVRLGKYDENRYSSDAFFFAKAALYAKYCGVRYRNIPEYLNFFRRHANSMTQKLPTFDTRSRRAHYHEYCKEKLEAIRRRIEEDPTLDIASELRKCNASDFVDKYGHKFAEWESEPVDEGYLMGLASWGVESLNKRNFVTCVCTLDGCEKMLPDVAKRFKHFDLLRAMAFYCLGRKEQALHYLKREIDNHQSPGAYKFMQDYFENESTIDVLTWCSKYNKVFGLRIVNVEMEEGEVVSQSDMKVQQRQSILPASGPKEDRRGKGIKKTGPLVSVVMPVYNGQRYLAEAVKSVLEQDYDNFEIVFIDDGSTDGTDEVIQGFADNRIRYFRQSNRGLAASHNEGIKKARGEFLIKVDADDFITGDFISRHIKQFEQDPQADLVYCDDYLIEEDGTPIRIITRPEYAERRMLIRDLFRAGFPVVPFRTCIRRRVFDTIGLFDEKLRIGEDYDMMRRFVKAGLKVRHLRAPLYYRRLADDSLSRQYSEDKAREQFDIVKSYAETFSAEELFPDVQWERIPAGKRRLHFKCLVAMNFISLGRTYIEANLPEYAGVAFDNAGEQLKDCFENGPDNSEVRRLMARCENLKRSLSPSGVNGADMRVTITGADI